jgi:hypothetical protein
MAKKKSLTHEEQEAILAVLEKRFHEHMHRHANVSWEDVQSALLQKESFVWSLAQMENTGGEPDVSNLHDGEQIVFVDFSKESPSGRRSLCYDEEALENRKANKPKNSALGLAREMGIELLTEEEYRKIQELEAFDLKTSTWVKTPEKIRKLGGAIFCDRRYDTVFTYHNGADSYYASRGFRGKLSVPKVK